MSQTPNFIQLNSRYNSLIIDCQLRTPAVLYFGEKLSNTTDAASIKKLSTRQEVNCALVVEAPISLSPLLGEGFTGNPGIEVHNANNAWSLNADITSIVQVSESEVIFESVDDIRNIKIAHHLDLDFNSGVLRAGTTLTNLSEQALTVNHCAAPTMPLPDNMNKIISFEGRWSNEFLRNTVDLFLGSFVRENRKGKTSHDNFPGFVVHNQLTDEQQGECYGFHLGWSGNNKMRVEHLPEGRNYAQLGELLLPGEVVLEAQASYQSPYLYTTYSSQGFSGLSSQFHQFVRSNILAKNIAQKPRPVHYNTWEGIYFDHNVETLKSLADQVADLGVERFVLDDGWFNGRRNDKAGLGDWFVDKKIYPQGLTPLIDHVNAKGMEFGLWFEPEMVNPDSELFRQHPDWVLSVEGSEQMNFRNQVVLDLTRSEVTAYLFEVIDNILAEYPNITYIKWDNNRDYNHAGNAQGKPAINQQTTAFYQLVDRIKAAHPHLEIESCSSGGSRIDYEVLRHTDRVWTSDSNDALDRLSIQRGCSFFFPAEIMGAHVGPRDCHITGRNVKMAMRSAVSFFGHMGIEMDPRELTDEESALLKEIISLHKKHRSLIHSGELVRMNDNQFSVEFGIVNQDKSQALYSYNSIKEVDRTNQPKYRFIGLDANKTYRVDLIWPSVFEEYSPSVIKQVNGKEFTGSALINCGMQLPRLFPQSSLIFELTAV
ncbi:MAG: alpha-galactosidase [Thalassotalea sp.]